MSDVKKNEIVSFLHCAKCSKEKPVNQSRGTYARLEIGITKRGVQVWCVRHRMEVGHLTADDIREYVARGPLCECCPGGMHRN